MLKLKRIRHYLIALLLFLPSLIFFLSLGSEWLPDTIYFRIIGCLIIILQAWVFAFVLKKRMKVSLQKVESILQGDSLKLKKALEENKLYTEQIERQKLELEAYNEGLLANQAILRESRNDLKQTLEENKLYVEQIELQKAELHNNNEELRTTEEELRQNLEELASTQEVLEQNQIKLRLTLAKNQSIMQALDKSVIVSITDLKGNILQVNKNFCQITGYTKEELIGENQSIVNSGHHSKDFWKDMWRKIGRGNVWRAEIKNKTKNGSIYWVDSVISPMYDEQGRFYNYLSIRYPITEKKKDEERIQKQHKQINEINESINASIDYALNIQRAMLPNPYKINRQLPENFIFFKPRDVVSGDFYFFANRNYKAVIAAVDCTGHGIPGAFMSMIGNQILHEIVNVKGITQPHKILSLLRNGIIRVLKQKDNNNRDGMDIAVCTIDRYPEQVYNVIGVPHLEYAGVQNPLIYFQDNEMFQIEADKIIIGGFEHYSPNEKFTLHRIPLGKPTTFYIFSDGIQDQFGGIKRKKFSKRRLKDLLHEIHQKEMHEQAQIISDTIENWQQEGNEAQIDDMLLIGVRI